MFQGTRRKSVNPEVGVPGPSMTASSAFPEFRFADLAERSPVHRRYWQVPGLWPEAGARSTGRRTS